MTDESEAGDRGNGQPARDNYSHNDDDNAHRLENASPPRERLQGPHPCALRRDRILVPGQYSSMPNMGTRTSSDRGS